MNTQLFIPKRCKVGFNLREDCYTKKLGYVIAQDGKKWRKENSWESWRQKEDQCKSRIYDYSTKQYIGSEEKFGEEVRPIEFDNIPTSGFVLNKKVGGYKSDWNMRQTYARVYDPRGFEFEINIVNLLYILENCNCMRGKGLEGEFIYAWDGKDLVLLPCASWEYEKANTFTKLQSNKVSIKEMIPGCSYKTKKEEDLVYVGRYMWYESDWYKNKGRTGKKYHIFYNPKKKYDWHNDFITKTDLSFLASKNSDEPVANFAEIVDKLNQKPEIVDILNFELVPAELILETTDTDYYGPKLKKTTFFKKDGNIITQYDISLKTDYVYNKEQKREYKIKGYTIETGNKIDISNKEIQRKENDYTLRYYNHNRLEKFSQKEDLQIMGLCDLFITLQNGKKIQINSLQEI